MFSLRRWFVAAALILAAVVTGFTWAASSPVGSSPDDDYHLASIWCPPPVEHGSCRVERDGAGTVTAVYVPEKIVSSAACYAFHPDVSAACQETFSDTKLVPTDRYDRGEYPGGYYRVMNLLVGPGVEASVLAMRILNVVVTVALIGAALWATPPRERYPVVLAVIGTAVPLTLFVVASMNPTAWSYAGLTAAWAGLYAALSAPTRARQLVGGAASVVGGVLAVNARADSAIFLAGLTIMVLIVALERPWLRVVPGVVVGVNLVVAVASFLGSRAAQTGFSFHGPIQRDPSWLFYNNLVNWPSIFMGNFGVVWGLGWLDTRMPALVWAGSSLVVLGLLFAGLAELTVRKTIGLAGLFAVLLVVPLFMLQTGSYVVGEAVQPRYILPLVPPLVWVALRGRRTRFLALSAAQAWTIVVALSLAGFVALQTNIQRYVTGLDGGFFFGPAVEWWDSPIPPKASLVLGAAAFAVVVLAVPAAVRDARAPATPRAATEPAASDTEGGSDAHTLRTDGA